MFSTLHKRRIVKGGRVAKIVEHSATKQEDLSFDTYNLVRTKLCCASKFFALMLNVSKAA